MVLLKDIFIVTNKFEMQDDELDVLKLEGLYGEAVVGAQHDGGYQIGQVNSNPFDFHDAAQYHMALAHPSVFSVPSNIPPQIVGMQPYQDSYNNAQQLQEEEPFVTMIKKSTNPFDEPNILPPASASAMPSHPT